MAMYFSVTKAASECGLSMRTLHSAIKKGQLRVIRVGRRVLISPAALEAYLSGRGIETTEVGHD